MKNFLVPVDFSDTSKNAAEYAAQLYFDSWAPLLLFTGKSGQLTSLIWEKSEAEMFADVALKMGVPSEKIMIEDRSNNTGENITLSRDLLLEQGVSPGSFIVVTKPYMERRAFATFKKVWPEPTFTVTSPPIPWSTYPNETMGWDLAIRRIVATVKSVREYPDRGFQIFQEIPGDVWKAYEELVELGYGVPRA